MINLKAMLNAANSKYSALLDTLYGQKAESESNGDYDKAIRLVHSMYNDQVELLAQLSEAEKENERKEMEGLQIVSFVNRD
ncbi:hypothetical protein [Blautia glucerasea]|uniref:hypothetical protein n=1 Tax=Blautia glucerasea TaxID=536633 RepID=UPI00156EBF87|nr:hypothetical protein [Blautia glucerasea]NSJ25470.1 hypothetical protein [Blautia glucerasea]